MAGMIPRDFIDQLIQRVDIVDVINQRVPLKKHGREYQACCPFHNEKTPSFTVSPNKQFYHCFGCGQHGSAITFLMEFEHLGYVEAIETLADTLGMEVPREQGSQPARPKVAEDVYSVMQQVAQFYQQQLQRHVPTQQYVQQRGLSAEMIERFLLGYAPEQWNAMSEAFRLPAQQEALQTGGVQSTNEQGRVYDRFRGRLMFPIRDRRGRVIGFGGRVLGEGAPKYLNSPETELFHKGRELYGLYEARQHTRHLTRMIVVEGYMDVVALAQFGISYAVATLGTATTQEHVQLLFKSVPEVIFCFDGDRAGKQAAWRALQNCLPELRDDREIRFLFLPTGEDPDSLVRSIGQERFEALYADALPLSDYLLQHLREEYNTSTREGRTRLLDAALKLLANMPELLLRQQILTELGRWVNLDIRVLQQRLTTRGRGALAPAETPDMPVNNLVSDKNIRMTPVRFAITLLLHYPELVEYVGNPEQLARYPLPGIDLLLALVEKIEETPHIHSAGLLESLRASRYEKSLLKLMTWQPQQADEAVIQQEFQDCLRQIRRQGLEKQLEDLLHREQVAQLNEQEQYDLRSLLAEIHNQSG